VIPVKYKSQLTAIVYLLAIILLYTAMEALDGSSELYLNTSADTSSIATAVAIEPGKDGAYDIFIDLTQSMLYLFKDNKLLKKYPVAQGKPETPSPIGIWQITSKARNWGTGFGTRWL
jgi:lipoprotein-anchoring transpeptidase ErfK/SrfK